MDIEITSYIDFSKLFADLFNYHENDLIEYQYESETYSNLLKFNASARNSFDLIIDECELSDKTISFIFGYDFNDANESNTQSSSADYHIIYDRILDEFTDCIYSQG